MIETGNGEIVVFAEIAGPAWRAADIALEDTVTAAARAAVAGAGIPFPRGAELGIRLTDDAEIRCLNREWRDRDTATNVLAFALNDTAAPGADEGAPAVLGDIVIAYETCAGEARDQDKPLADHLSHLVVHGALHLLGFDHEDAADAEAMEALERAVLDGLGVPDPYLDSEAA